jgi:hypothetical protein
MANIATNSSGKEVEKATRINPTVAFPKPVAPAIFTECLIVKLLAWFRANKATIRINKLPINPSSPNIFYSSVYTVL